MKDVRKLDVCACVVQCEKPKMMMEMREGERLAQATFIPMSPAPGTPKEA